MGFVPLLVWKHYIKFRGQKLRFEHSYQRKSENVKSGGFKDLPRHFAPDAKDTPQVGIRS